MLKGCMFQGVGGEGGVGAVGEGWGKRDGKRNPNHLPPSAGNSFIAFGMRDDFNQFDINPLMLIHSAPNHRSSINVQHSSL